MKVSIDWLKELVEIKDTLKLINLFPLRTIATKEVAEKYIELDMKGYNRADLLALRGVAYEVAAITDSGVKFSEAEDFIWSKGDIPGLDVEIEDKQLSPLYALAKVEGLRVGESTSEIKKKLEDSGIRSINNIADVTNLVMIEYGQPLHAFDAATVKDEKIIVRTAKTGEKLVTLDNKGRTLETSDLLIADPEKALGIAGVMGGKNSEVSDTTTTILLEAAIFDPINLRRTAQRLGLHSEASKRFQHGLTEKRLLQALSAAVEMYQELGGNLTGLSIEGEYNRQQPRVNLRQSKVNSLIGVEIKPEEIENYLRKLNFNVTRISHPERSSEGSLPEAAASLQAGLVNTSQNKSGDSSATPQNDIAWEVIPPYYRLDIEIEEDVIEEIARMYGYEKIPAKELVGETPAKIDQSLFNLISDLKQSLVAIGFTEVQTYSYFSTRSLAALNFDDPAKLVKVANPISSETEYLRQDIWPNLLDVVSNNLKSFDDIAIFEIGKAYLSQEGEAPKESYRLSLALTNNTDNPTQELYQMVVDVLEQVNVSVDLGEDDRDEVAKKLFHPTRFSTLLFNGQPKAGLAEIHPRILHKYGIEKRVAVVEMNLNDLLID